MSGVHRIISHDPSLGQLLRHAARTLPDDPGHDVHHCLRVAGWTLRLGGEGIDPREGIAAALLHDIVNLPKDHPDRHHASTRSAEEAGRLLPEAGFDPRAVSRIAEAIQDHSYSRGAVPRSALGRALQDADRLEALGAIGIMRCISTGSRMGAAYFHPEDPWARARPLDDLRYSVDHFFKKLLRLPATMCTEAGRAEAERRANTVLEFIRALGAELGEPAPQDELTRP